MRRFKSIFSCILYVIIAVSGMIMICVHTGYSFRTFGTDICLTDELLWSIYRGIYVIYTAPVTFVFLYHGRLRRITDMQRAVRGRNRSRIIFMQEICISGISLINAAVCMSGIFFVWLHVRVYCLQS